VKGTPAGEPDRSAAGGSCRPVEGATDPAGGIPRLTLFVRAGCHLCEDMADGLAELFEPGAFTLEHVDIDADPALRARYDVDVPVLVDGADELCRHFLDPVAVTEHLAGYTSARRASRRPPSG